MVSRFYFVADHQHAYGVKRLCKALGVSRSGFHRWQSAADARAARSAADTALLQQIRAVHAASTGTYGVPRVTAELREGGMRVNHKRVERLMREHRIVGVARRKMKRRRTTRDHVG